MVSQDYVNQSNPLHKFELRRWPSLAMLQLQQHWLNDLLSASAKALGFDPRLPGSDLGLYNSAIHNMYHLMFESHFN